MARQSSLIRLAVPLFLLAIVAGCSGDARLKTLEAGIPKDSVVKLMGVDSPQRVDPYLTGAMPPRDRDGQGQEQPTGGHYIEAMYYRQPGKTDSVADRKLSPVVVIDGKLAGWGWKSWDSIAGANKIAVAKK